MKKLYSLLLVVLIFTSCRKEATRWNSDWSVPLLNDTLTLKNWVNDSTLKTNPTGYYDVDLKRELFRFDLNSIVGIPDTTMQNNFSIPTSINVPPGYSFVNQTEERDLMLDPIELTKIHLKKGVIKIVLKNPYPTKVISSITLPNVKINGVIVTANLEVAAGTLGNPTEGSKIIDLTGAQMDLTGLSGGNHNKLLSKIKITADPNGVAVLSTSEYLTQVFATIKDIEIEYAKGYFGQQSFSDTVETDVEILKSWISGDLNLPNLNLDLKLTNGIKAMGNINIKELITTKANGSSISLISNQINVPQNINSASGSWSSILPSEMIYSFHSGNSNIQDFIANAGSKIKLVYEFNLNPLGNQSGSWNEIYPQSAVKLDLNLQMPLGFNLDKFTITDTFKLDLTKYSKQLGQGRSATVFVDLQNSFPVQGRIMVKFIDQNNQTILELPEYKTIQSGLFGNSMISGALTAATAFTWEIMESDFKKLSGTTKVLIIGEFDTPNPVTMVNSTVLLNENSLLLCKLRLNLQYENKYE